MTNEERKIYMSLGSTANERGRKWKEIKNKTFTEKDSRLLDMILAELTSSESLYTEIEKAFYK